MKWPGRPWSSTYWDALRYYYWSVRFIGLRSIPKRDIVYEDGWIKFRSDQLMQRKGSVYVRSQQDYALEAELHRDEVTLNQVLSTTLAIAGDGLIERLLARPLGIEEKGPFERIGDEIAERFGWGSDNVVQPDGFYVGSTSAIALEIKLAARTSPEQILKYAALMSWEEEFRGPREKLGLLYIVPEPSVALFWQRAKLSGPEDVPALLGRLASMKTLPSRVRALIEVDPDRLNDSLMRMRVEVISWSALLREIEAVRAQLGVGMGEETLDRLLAGLVAQIEAHDGTGLEG